jgi:hypothetical protein
VDPILERISARRAHLAEQAEQVGKQLVEIEAELARVASAEQVVGQLLAEDEAAGEDDPAMVAGVEPGRVVPYRNDAAGPGDLSAEYQRVLAAWPTRAPRYGASRCANASASVPSHARSRRCARG